MAEVVIAAGSNLGNRLDYLQKAGRFLGSISGKPVIKSSVWESEPVGPAQFTFLNAVALIQSPLPAETLLDQLKEFEHKLGRSRNPKRWRPRNLDLDIIACGNLVLHTENLIIPHPEYHRRLFVLLPLQELRPGWSDPKDQTPIDRLIRSAPNISIQKTNLEW